MVMKIVNIHEAKARFSECVDAAAKGERVLICKRNQPIAELRAIQQKRTEPRPVGGATGVQIPPAFFDPMPDDWLDAFDDAPLYPVAAPPANRVAERRPEYGRPPRRKRKR
jgi:antitoxin (DNA-binding transcriptional repressor) of toxin-antitoxin stability system